MSGIKGFSLGFFLSLASVALYEQLCFSAPVQKKPLPIQQVKINLFKKTDNISIAYASKNIFSPVEKLTLKEDVAGALSSPGLSPEGVEDDEILGINIDGNIPIEFEALPTTAEQAEVVFDDDNEEKTAYLPDELKEDEQSTSNNPWIMTQTADKDGKPLFTEQLNNHKANLFTDTIKTAQDDEVVSYKVAEKIKQSIIFPIPDEILNDENLTPTFIRNEPIKAKQPPKPKEEKKVTAEPRVSIPEKQETELVIPSAPEVKEKKEVADKGILDSISSWFSEKPIVPEKQEEKNPPKKFAPPSYSSQGQTETASTKKSSNDFANFYETLQNTKKEHIQRRIVPSELKLSFQPGRAEISGSTLQWLKAFSEATQNENTYIQVRLDAGASMELQKKRLNLLYTIFMNNGVNFQKVETLFSSTEPDAFVIRIIRFKQSI